MNCFWHISEKYRSTVLAQVFSDLDQTFSIQGKHVTRSPDSHVIKVRIEDRFYYVKRYSRGGKRLRRFIGRSRVRAEWENLSFFSQLGIPIPRIVAYGQELRWGLFRRGALITEELENTIDMAALAKSHSPLLKNKNWFAQASRQIANFTKRLHDNRFIHYDLKWRNILVTKGIPPQVFLIDCPLGRKWSGPILQRGIIKDLACLDKVAKNYLSRTARLRFFMSYRDHSKLTKVDKLLINKVLVFFSGRE